VADSTFFSVSFTGDGLDEFDEVFALNVLFFLTSGTLFP
jgi:hypothetical protein